MSAALDDEALLDALRSSLAPTPVRPDAAELDALRVLLASRHPSAGAVGAPVRPVGTRDGIGAAAVGSTTAQTSFRSPRLRRVRHPVTALVAAAVLATGGVAAAGVAADTLPGPARQIAFAVGLPVSSPALETTRGAMDELRGALARHDAAAVRSAGETLRRDLAVLAPADRNEVEPAAGQLLTRADAFLDAVTGAAGATTSGATAGNPQSSTGSADPGRGRESGSSPTDGPAAPASPSEGPGGGGDVGGGDGGGDGSESGGGASSGDPTGSDGTSGGGQGSGDSGGAGVRAPGSGSNGSDGSTGSNGGSGGGSSNGSDGSGSGSGSGSGGSGDHGSSDGPGSAIPNADPAARSSGPDPTMR